MLIPLQHELYHRPHPRDNELPVTRLLTPEGRESLYL